MSRRVLQEPGRLEAGRCRSSLRAATVVGMSAPTLGRSDTTHGEAPPGPAEVLAALAQFSPPETLVMIDRQVDEAYRASLGAGDPTPLQKVLEHWWLVVRLNRGEVDPPFEPMTREKLKATWEARHPGETLPI